MPDFKVTVSRGWGVGPRDEQYENPNYEYKDNDYFCNKLAQC